MFKESLENQNQSSQWEKPTLQEEIGELKRTAEALSVPLEILKSAYEKAELSELSDEDWEQMKNSDSRDTTWTAEEVRVHLKEKRDFGRIEQGITKGDKIPAPIVLYRKNNPPYLIAGNSRLLACRVFNKRPIVLKLQL